MASAIATASSQLMPAAACSLPTTLIDSDIVAAIDRSKTPEIRQIVAASAMMPVMAWLARSTRTFASVLNVSGIQKLKTSSRTRMM